MEQARFMHRFLSRSDESAEKQSRGLKPTGPQAKACGSDWRARGTRHGSVPANVLLSTLRSRGVPACGSCNAVGADDFVDAVENLCIIRARLSRLLSHLLVRSLESHRWSELLVGNENEHPPQDHDADSDPDQLNQRIDKDMKGGLSLLIPP